MRRHSPHFCVVRFQYGFEGDVRDGKTPSQALARQELFASASPARSAFIRPRPVGPASSKKTPATAGQMPATKTAGPKCFCGPRINPVMIGAVAPADTEIVFRNPTVRPTIFFGGTC